MIMLVITIFLILFAAALSWAITVGIIKLITMCFGMTFSLLVATGIWLILCLVSAFFKGASNQK